MKHVTGKGFYRVAETVHPNDNISVSVGSVREPENDNGGCRIYHTGVRARVTSKNKYTGLSYWRVVQCNIVHCNIHSTTVHAYGCVRFDVEDWRCCKCGFNFFSYTCLPNLYLT